MTNRRDQPKPLALRTDGPVTSVSVLVLNHNGRRHLETCLPSLEAQSYPADRFEIVMVDNGSTDGSVAFVRDRHPRARVMTFDRNRGFADAYNLAVQSCATDFVAFLNNDTRVDPDWLAELVQTALKHGAASAASRILDWTGERVDFAGGVVSMFGHCWQRDAGKPAAREYKEDTLLFACAGSMLVSREAFLDVGGFDDSFFAYFEDVDLGWRLSLLGYKTILAPRAITYHRLHGTAGRWAFAQRLLLYERNALAMIYKNYESGTLMRVLPAAVSLSLTRGLTDAPLDPRMFRIDGQPPAVIAMPTKPVAHLLALEAFGCDLPALTSKRNEIQRRRTRTDRELFALFGEPLRLHTLGAAGARIARALVDEFDLEELVREIELPKSRQTTSSAGGSHPPGIAKGQVSQRDEWPRVSIVVLTALGPEHLVECLSSLDAQTYPADRRELIVVDNGSSMDPTNVVQQHYPGGRLLRNATNLGFAAGNNRGARAAGGEYVVFLNDDTRADPGWLAALVDVARRRHAAVVASRILNWRGDLNDFIGGSVNFEAKGFQIGFETRADGGPLEEKPLLFPCGAAMLVNRAAFLDAGGWDEGTFAYYEDVELGWRFWLLGHEVWFAPEAVVFHKHHGTSGRWAEPPRLRLYERNSLRILFTHLERSHLERVLTAALLLAADRAILDTRLSRAEPADLSSPRQSRWHQMRPRLSARSLLQRSKHALVLQGARKHFSIGQNLRRVGVTGLVDAAQRIVHETVMESPQELVAWRAGYFMRHGARAAHFDLRVEPFPAAGAARLLGVKEFLNDVPDLVSRRRDLQSRRCRSDEEILGRFATNWLSPSPAARQSDHNRLHAAVIASLGIDEMASLNLVTDDRSEASNRRR